MPSVCVYVNSGTVIPDNTEVLRIHTANLSEIEIPDSVTEIIINTVDACDISELALPPRLEIFSFFYDMCKGSLDSINFPPTLSHLCIRREIMQRLSNINFPMSLEKLEIEVYREDDLHYSAFPVGLKELVLSAKYKLHIDEYSLPKKLSKLTINPLISPNNPDVFPDSLEELCIVVGSCGEYNMPKYPRFLTVLRLGVCCEYTIRPGELPDTIKILTHGNYNQILSKDIIPKYLEELDLGSRYNQPLMCDVFPETLRVLKIYSRYLPVLGKNSLPKCIESFSLGIYYGGNLHSDIFPSDLQDLHLGDRYTGELTENTLPPNLVSLNLGRDFDEDISSGMFPGTLAKLNMGLTYTRKIGQNNLPANLIELRLSESYNHDIDYIFLPDTIEFLSLGNKFGSKIVVECLPLNLKYLSVCTREHLEYLCEIANSINFSIIYDANLIATVSFTYPILINVKFAYDSSYQNIETEIISGNEYNKLVNPVSFEPRSMCKSAKK